ncbi:MAG TPA: hypothetical protein VG012_04415 [Acidimicrobiia bacterium]|jgi:hypothetical protein|nr:hypothetical protein [Acidimicrobiia bacterium]
MREDRIRSVVLAKWADYAPALPATQVRFLSLEPYLDEARRDERVRADVQAGWFDDFDAEFRDPVLADPVAELVVVCPPMMHDIIEPEPPRIQRAFVEGAFMRRLFRLLVEGTGWEADAQVRDVMARHFPFQLVAVEAVESAPHPAT